VERLAIPAKSSTFVLDENEKGTYIGCFVNWAEGAPLVLQFRLSDETGSLGLSCVESGVSLAGAPLLRKTALGFASRPKAEIGALMKAAYGDAFGDVDLSPRLAVVADALNKGHLGRARIAAVQMRLPELSWDRAILVARTEERLAKYDPDEPRDWRGRWTAANDRPPADLASATARPQPPSTPERRGSTPFTAPDPIISESGPAHLYGGRLIHTDWPENEPVESVPIPEAEPILPGVRVSAGWDTPGETGGGLTYPSTRHPTFPDGKPWPTATHDAIKAALAPISGRQAPMMVLYVPIDGKGPTLIGATRVEEFNEPKGYSAVKLIGTPQLTYSRGEETGHAADSIAEAIRLADTNQFSEIYFNRSLMTSTRGALQDLIRPDVFAIVRPEIKIGYIYHPYETLSPGQSLRLRIPDYPTYPGLRLPKGKHYKFAGLVISPYFRILG
jgi:hypothetical protein